MNAKTVKLIKTLLIIYILSLMLLITVVGVRAQSTVAINEAIERGALTPEILSAIAGAVISLLASFTPRFKTWYNNLGVNPDGSDDDGRKKQGVMLVILTIVTTVIVLVSCSGYGSIFPFEMACTSKAIWSLIMSLLWSITFNQSMFSITKRFRPDYNKPGIGAG